jgi:hypothetical protein
LNNKSYTASLPETASGKALQRGKRYMYKILFDEAEVHIGGDLSAWDDIPGGNINIPPDNSRPTSIHVDGYSGKVTVTYTSNSKETLTLDADGYAKFGDAHHTETIRSLTLDNATASTAILIGRKVADSNPLSLRTDATGKPILREAVNGYIPIGYYAEFQLINESGNISANKKYRQESPLDLMNEEWKPIGSLSYRFFGEYDGGEHAIANLKISGSEDRVGLFGETVNSTLRNIRLVSGSVSGVSFVGAVCGQALGTSLTTNIHSAASVTAAGNCGGICGKVADGIVSFCRNTGNLTVINYIQGTGGIVGAIDRTVQIINCDNSGNIEGSLYVGGILGNSYIECKITACRNTGNIKGSEAGGILGYDNSKAPTIITACYNTGSVNNTGSDSGGGGIIGTMTASSVVNACYSTGTINASSGTNGLICGVNSEGTISSCFYTKGSSTVDKGVGTGTGDTKAFSASAWPTTSLSGWGIGDGSGDNKYWKDLGGWHNGSPVYPKLWWE